MSALPFRFGSIFSAAGVVVTAVLASTPARACDPPRVVSVQTVFAVGDEELGGSFSLEAFFLEPHATFEVSGTALPVPTLGTYRLVFEGDSESLEMGTFDVDETGAAQTGWDWNLDLREFVLGVGTVELFDQDVLVASSPVTSRGQLALFAEGIRHGGQTVPPRLTFNGFIERRSADYAFFDLRLDGVKVPRGEYILELAGLRDTYEIPFTSGQDRRVTVRLLGTDQDLLQRAVAWNLVRVRRGDLVLATLPLQCR